MRKKNSDKKDSRLNYNAFELIRCVKISWSLIFLHVLYGLKTGAIMLPYKTYKFIEAPCFNELIIY